MIIKITFNCGWKKYNRYVRRKQLLHIIKIFLISFVFLKDFSVAMSLVLKTISYTNICVRAHTHTRARACAHYWSYDKNFVEPNDNIVVVINNSKMKTAK